MNAFSRIGALLVAVMIALVWCTAAAAADCPERGDGWQFKQKKSGICIYNREKEGSPIKELLATTTIERPVWRLVAAVGDYDHFEEFMPYTEAGILLHSAPKDEKTTVNYFFTVLDPPLVNKRYYTLRLDDQWDPDGTKGGFRSKWTLSDDPAHDPAPTADAVAGEVPKGSEDAIKTPINDGHWLFTPTNGGKAALVEYYVYTDPGGAIPTWIANQANSVAVPKLMDALTERSGQARYDAKAPK